MTKIDLSQSLSDSQTFCGLSTVCSGGRTSFIINSVLLVAVLLTMAADTATLHQQGVQFYHQKQYSQAALALESSIKNEQAGSAAYQESALFIGQSYFMLSQAPKAIPWLQKLPTVNEANYMLGYAYLQTKQEEQSEAAFARLFTQDPASAAGHLMAAQMMLKKDYDDEANKQIEAALALEPKLPEAHFLLGEIQIFRGRLAEAIRSLQQELSLNPNFAQAWYRLGDAFTRQEDWGAAIPVLQRAVWLNPEYSGPYILLGKAYFKQGNLTTAEGLLRRALVLDPHNQSAAYVLSQTLMGEGKRDEARAVLDKLKAEKKPPLLPEQSVPEP